LTRDQAYVGVLIDDLATKPQIEPYRIFTSRAEYRLLLRQDNADMRLTPIGHELGLISAERYEATERKRRAIQRELGRLEETWLRPTDAVNATMARAGLPAIDDGLNALALLRRPQSSYALIEAVAPCGERLPAEVVEQVQVEARYAGYIARQQVEVERMARLENRRIPETFDFQAVPGLRNEAREQLVYYRPLTVGQASRLSGVTPADVAILLVYLDRGVRAVAGG
jgi:tRNA uridine 5-carboxymethylaminomethyl modification enzyme